MILYQSPYGGTLKLTEEQYFNMSDEAFEKLLMYAEGASVEDPFFNSSIHNDKKKILRPEEYLSLDVPEIIEEFDLEGYEELDTY